MNKLISNNPILKFKLGLKILKMLYGSSGIFRKTINNTAEKIIAAMPGNPYLTTRRLVRTYHRVLNPRKTKKPIETITSVATPTTTLETRTKTGPQNKPSSTSQNVSTNIFVKPGGRISDFDAYMKAVRNNKYFDEINKTGYLNFNSPLELQKSLNSYIQKYIPNIGLIKEDGLIGDLTRETLDNIYGDIGRRLKIGPYTPKPVPLTTPSIDLNEKIDIKPVPLITSSEKSNIYNFDRSQTRDWIRNNLKINPYNVSGAHRRALRYWLNGDREGLNYDKNLLGAFGDLSLYAKKGAKLVSGNPIERFKLNFR